MERSPDYSAFTDSIHISFTSEDAPAITPATAVKVDGQLIAKVGLDTGSTVFALSEKLVPRFTKADKKKLTPGSVGYSGRRDWDGYWFPVSVTIEGTEGITVNSEIDVLVVTKQTNNGKPEYDTIQYVGIGFGRFDLRKGYTPDKNPLLAITQYNDKPINDSTFRRGYIIQMCSIDIGLTGQNTESFQYTELTYGSSQPARWYWDRISVALSVNQGPWMKGVAFVDTGVTHIEIFSPQYTGDDGSLPDGTKVAMRFPDKKGTSLPEYIPSRGQGTKNLGYQRLSNTIKPNT